MQPSSIALLMFGAMMRGVAPPSAAARPAGPVTLCTSAALAISARPIHARAFVRLLKRLQRAPGAPGEAACEWVSHLTHLSAPLDAACGRACSTIVAQSQRPAPLYCQMLALRISCRTWLRTPPSHQNPHQHHHPSTKPSPAAKLGPQPRPS